MNSDHDEVLVTCQGDDGTRQGQDLELHAAASEEAEVPPVSGSRHPPLPATDGHDLLTGWHVASPFLIDILIIQRRFGHYSLDLFLHEKPLIH